METMHRVAKNTGILYLRLVITIFISLYSTRLVLAALGVESFGLYNLVGGLIGMLGFLNASMASATQRFVSVAQGAGELNKVKRIFNVSFILHAGLAIIVALVLEIVGHFIINGLFNIPTERMDVANWVYQFMIVSALFSIVSVPYDAVITSHENMTIYAILGLVESILKLVIALYITYGKRELPAGLYFTGNQINISYGVVDNLIVYGFLMATLSVLMFFIRIMYCHMKYTECELNLKKYYDKQLLKQISHFAGWSFLVSSSSMLSYYGQGLVMNIFFGTVVNAAQGIASQINGHLGTLSSTLMKALNPMIAKSEGAGKRTLMLKAAMAGSKMSFFLLMIVYIPFLIEAPYLLNLWLNDIPEYSVIFCQLLLIRNLIDQLFIPINTAVLSQGEIKHYQISLSVAFALPLLISYILFELHYPAYALYIVFLINSIVALAIILFFAKKKCQLPLKEFLINVVVRCLSAFMFVFIVTLLPYYLIDPGTKRLVITTTTSTFCYFIAVRFIGFSKDEREKIRKMTSHFYNKVIEFLL